MQRRKLCVALRFDAFYEDKKMRTTHVVVKPYDKKWKMDFERFQFQTRFYHSFTNGMAVTLNVNIS